MTANDSPLAEITFYPGTGAYRWLDKHLADRPDGHVFLIDRDTDPRVEYLADGIEKFLACIFELAGLEPPSIFLVAEVTEQTAVSITARAWLAIYDTEVTDEVGAFLEGADLPMLRSMRVEDLGNMYGSPPRWVLLDSWLDTPRRAGHR